jgi:hypothetical protein
MPFHIPAPRARRQRDAAENSKGSRRESLAFNPDNAELVTYELTINGQVAGRQVPEKLYASSV